MNDKELAPWERYNQTAEQVWVSDEEAYGRRAHAVRVEWVCDVCKQETTVLDVDTSDGEYLSFACCLPCFTKMIEARTK